MDPRSRLLLSLGLAVIAAVALAPTAALAQRADEDVARARALFEEGVAFVDQGRWAEAEERFRRALELRPSRVIEYNLASALAAQGEVAEAYALLEGVLAEPDLPRDLRQASELLRAEIEPRLAHVTITLGGAFAGAVVVLDGEEVPAERLGAPMRVDPGPHEAVATTAAGEARRAFEVAPGEALAIELVLPLPTPAEVAASSVEDEARGAADREERPLVRKPWFWATVGGVVAAAVVTTALLARDRTADPTVGTFPPGLVMVEVGR